MTSKKNLQRLEKLKKGLERTAFASLIADICISAVTLVSLKTGQSAAILEILFIFNYVLAIIVIIALVIMAWTLVLSHYHRIPRLKILFEKK